MPDLADLYPGYASDWIDTSAGRIFARSGGKGPPGGKSAGDGSRAARVLHRPLTDPSVII
jgi:hypothetical protein